MFEIIKQKDDLYLQLSGHKVVFEGLENYLEQLRSEAQENN